MGYLITKCDSLLNSQNSKVLLQRYKTIIGTKQNLFSGRVTVITKADKH